MAEGARFDLRRFDVTVEVDGADTDTDEPTDLEGRELAVIDEPVQQMQTDTEPSAGLGGGEPTIRRGHPIPSDTTGCG